MGLGIEIDTRIILVLRNTASCLHPLQNLNQVNPLEYCPTLAQRVTNQRGNLIWDSALVCVLSLGGRIAF